MKASRLIDVLFVAPTDNWFIQFFRYFFVGGFAFVVDYGLLVLLTEVFGLHYLVSATISFIAGLVVNYLLSTSWVSEIHAGEQMDGVSHFRHHRRRGPGPQQPSPLLIHGQT